MTERVLAAGARVVALGAGRMGAQVGCEYALAGYRVTVIARSRERVEAALAAALELARTTACFSAEELQAAEGRLTIAAGIEEVPGDAAVVFESVPEDLELKAQLLGAAGERWPEATLASNTSSIAIERLGAAIGRPERLLGTHYWSPPLLMPLVEVIATASTLPAVVASTVGTLRTMGKRPVLVRDVPGFVWNRLQFALLREALWLVENGVASPAVVDEIVRDGLARRWRYSGPFETADLGGSHTFAAIADNLFPLLSSARSAPGLRDRTAADPAALERSASRRLAGLLEELRRDDITPAEGDDSEEARP